MYHQTSGLEQDVKRPVWEIIALVLILITAAGLRFAGLSDYFPLFWDEAKYLGEVEGSVPQFGVNPAAFALLKLGYAILGRPSYAQAVFAMIGLLTVVGCFLLGRRILGGRNGTYLGLLMAGQAAVMPYFLKYSRHAFPAGVALCAFVFALFFYIQRLGFPRLHYAVARRKYTVASGTAIGLLALVPACSFNLLVPTVVLFALSEIVVWRARAARQCASGSTTVFIISLVGGAVLFFVLPFALATVSGYHGWLEHAIALLRSHVEIGTMRFGLQCLYPAHLYHLSGPVVVACGLAGAIVLFAKRGRKALLQPGHGTNLIMLVGFAVYVLFFGLFSHLQSARLYALTLPFVVYASSYFLLWAFRALPRVGTAVTVAVSVLIFTLSSWSALVSVSAPTGFKTASDIIARQVCRGQSVRASAAAQIAYGLAISPFLKVPGLTVDSYLTPAGPDAGSGQSPIAVINDPTDIATTVATLEKYDALSELDLDTVRAGIQGYAPDPATTQPVFAGRDDFCREPYYYLEDVYSWRSYRYIKELLRTARDSIFVYVPKVAEP